MDWVDVDEAFWVSLDRMIERTGVDDETLRRFERAEFPSIIQLLAQQYDELTIEAHVRALPSMRLLSLGSETFNAQIGVYVERVSSTRLVVAQFALET